MAVAAAVPWQREGHSTASSYLVCNGAQKVIDFMTEVLKAKVMWNVPTPDKTGVLHACLKIGDATIMLQDANAQNAAAPAWVHIYLEDVDKTYELALQHKSCAQSVQAPKDECFGDRLAAVKDSAGNTWWIATHKFLPHCPAEHATEPPCPEST